MTEPTLYLFHKNEPLKLSTGKVHKVRLIAPRLESDLPLRQLQGVAKTFERAAFGTWMRGLFGDIPKQAYDRMFDDLRAGAVQMPPLKLKAEVPRGHVAAYDSESRCMLFAHALVRRALADDDEEGRWLFVAALLEEFGHHVDHLLRNEYSSVGGDARNDEGAKFGYALLNLDWASSEQTEIARLVYPFGVCSIDARWSEYRDMIKPLMDAEHQDDVDRWRQYEFFEAGRGSGRDHSFGHQSIEDALRRADKNVFEDKVREEIYFGNWLRDFSQAITPLPLKVFSRDLITKFLDLYARSEFGDSDKFQVTPAILGVYRTEDHLDNPAGLEDGTADDPDLNKACVDEQSQIDGDSWLQKHLRSHVPGCTSGFERIQHWLRLSMATSGAERHRHFGAALHALEDFYAHSNFLEVMLNELGHTAVYPWTEPLRTQPPGRVSKVYPVVTGCFGGYDTAASLLLTVGEDMQKLFKCEAGKRTKATEFARLALRDWRASWGARYEALLKLKDEMSWPWFEKVVCESIHALAAMVNYAIGGVVRLMGNQIDDAQTLFLTGANPYSPTHTQVAKDHDDHPLHELAAQCAMTAVKQVGGLMSQAWSGTKPLSAVIANVSSLMVHPAHIVEGSQAWAIRQLIADWATRNVATVQRLATRSWVEEASKSEEWIEFRRRASTLTEAWDAAAAEAQRAREVGLESYARKRALAFGDLLHRTLTDLRSDGVEVFDAYRELAQRKKRELTKQTIDAALARFRALVDEKMADIQRRSLASLEQYRALAQRKYAELTSAEVRARYQQEAGLAAERTMQELHGWTEQKLAEVEAEAERRRGELARYADSVEPAQVIQEKVARIRSIFDAKAEEAGEAGERLARELRELVRDVKSELEHPPPKSEFQLLLEREAVRLEIKVRALVAAISAKLRDPATLAEIEAFVEEQLVQLERLLERVFADARDGPEQKQVARAAGQELDRLHEPMQTSARELPSQARQTAESLKPKIEALEPETAGDPQLEYVEQLSAKTRGIEAGQRK